MRREGIDMITQDTKLIEVIQASPKIAKLLEDMGMGCVGCMGVTMETIGDCAKMHHLNLEEFLNRINKLAETDGNG